MSTCTQTITVNDTTPPVDHLPRPGRASSASRSCRRRTPRSVTASDNCGGARDRDPRRRRRPRTARRAATTSSRGPTRATDPCGNIEHLHADDHGQRHDAAVDHLPRPGRASSASRWCRRRTSRSVTASDNCGGAVTVTHVGDVGHERHVELQQRDHPDLSGARTRAATSSTCTQTITVNDTTPPTITCPGPVDASSASRTCRRRTPRSVTATDNCGGAVTVTHVGDAPTNGTSSCNNVITRTYQGDGPVRQHEHLHADDHGQRHDAPVLTCPGPVSVQCFSRRPGAEHRARSATSDNCGGPVTVTHVGDVPSTARCTKMITRTYSGHGPVRQHGHVHADHHGQRHDAARHHLPAGRDRRPERAASS